MVYQEKYNLELKESVSNTFLKTVSAYSNYNDGRIIFGISDVGEIKGISSIKDTMLQIENMVNDSIDPRPVYRLNNETRENKEIIILEIDKGKETPYHYKGKAYKRSDTSTTPVDRSELKHLVLAGVNLDYEESKSLILQLEFYYLENKLKEIVGIKSISADILKTLNLLNVDGDYNIAAELLSDKSNANSLGVDIVKFGASINEIQNREIVDNISILEQFDYAINVFERYYQYEFIEGYSRKERQVIPKEAFREALANALVHRRWDVKANTQISMYEDRIEISSPGGLPFGISEEAYLAEQVSVLRNPIIANVFHRLKIIEKFGTGVGRIIAEYQKSYSKPKFNVTEHNIKVILPVYINELPDISRDELIVYNMVDKHQELTRLEIDERTGFSKNKTIRILNNLLDKEIISVKGKGPNTKYKAKK